MIASFAVLIAALFSLANGHSTMSAPQPTASRVSSILLLGP